MIKILEDIKAKLDSKEAEVNERNRKFRESLKAAEKKNEELSRKLKEEEDPYEAQKILKELKDSQELYSFLIASKNKKFLPGSDLSKAECKYIKETVNKELRKMQMEMAPKIAKEINKVVALLDEYCEQAEVIDDLSMRAGKLCYGVVSNTYDTWNITTAYEDPFNYYETFCRAYFNNRRTVNTLKNSLKSKFKNPWINSDERKILNALKGEKSVG